MHNLASVWLTSVVGLALGLACSQVGALGGVVRVREQDGHTPIPSAEVLVESDSERAEFTPVHGRTGVDGRCELTTPSGLRWRVTARAEGFAPTRMWPREQGRDQGIVIELPRSVRLSGTVVDTAGRGVAGATVHLGFPQRLAGPCVPVEDLSVLSDSSGRWTAGCVPADTEATTVTVSCPGYERFSEGGGESAALGPVPIYKLLSAPMTTRLVKLLAVAGRVVNPDGSPASGATVWLFDQAGMFFVDQQPEAVADAAGVFSFPPRKPSQVSLAAWKAGGRLTTRVVRLDADRQPLEIRLDPPEPVTGVVQDEAGHPLAGVGVRVMRWGAFMGDLPFQAETDASGRWVLQELSPVALALNFSLPGRLGLSGVDYPEGGGEFSLRLQPAVRVRGSVVDGSTGRPIPRFGVRVGWAMGAEPGRLPGVRLQPKPPQVQFDDYNIQWFRDGAFLQSLNECPLGGVSQPPGMALRVEADGYEPAASRVFFCREERVSLEFRLEPIEEPRVSDPTGTDPVSAVAWALPQGVAAGAEAEVVAKVRVAAGYHLYTAEAAGSTFTAASLEVAQSEAVHLVNRAQGPQGDTNGRLTGELRFRQRIRIPVGTPPGPQMVECAVRFQACNEELCRPPARKAFTVRLNVLP